jgi:hypothetical protein
MATHLDPNGVLVTVVPQTEGVALIHAEPGMLTEARLGEYIVYADVGYPRVVSDLTGYQEI